MNRKDFLTNLGVGAAAIIAAQCGIGCNKQTTAVDFTLDISSGALSKNGGYIISNGVLVARTSVGAFVAVSPSCPHEGTSVNFDS